MSDKRPLSPHLGIYKPQLTSVLSIMHRFTGVFLFLGAVLLGWWVVLNAYGCGSCVNALVESGLGKIILFVWSLALYYHLFNGIRHLFWDMGKGFEIKTVNASGLVVLLSAVVFSVLSWYSVL